MPNSFEELWENEELADVIFLVGQEQTTDIWRFAAHILLLSKCSSVFASMFSTGNCENSERRFVTENCEAGPIQRVDCNINFDENNEEQQTLEISITDIPPEIFNQLLRYLYTNTLDIQSIDSAILLCQAAIKYELKTLVKNTVQYLSSNVTVKNVLYVYNFVEEYLDQEEFLPLHVICANIIDRNPENVFQTNAFLNLTTDALREITARSTLQLSSEVILFDALLRWSITECKRRHLIVYNENIRHVLGDILFNVRFGLLTHKEMLKVCHGNSSLKESLIQNSSSFNVDEATSSNNCQDSILRIEDKKMFRKDHRLNGNLSLSRFHGNKKIRIHIDPLEHSLKFTSHNRFILTSITLQSDCTARNKFQMFFSFSKENEVVYETLIKSPFCDSVNDTLLVPFPDPVYVEPFVNYEVYLHVEAGCVICEADITKSVCKWNDGLKDCYMQWKNSTLASGKLNGSAVAYGQLFQLNVILPLKNTEVDVSSMSPEEQKRINAEKFWFQFPLWQNRIRDFILH